jgi:hypothetical protein
MVIGHHHSLTIGGAIHPLAAVVCVADAMAADLGHSLEGEADSTQATRAADALGISSAQILNIRRQAKKLLAS